MSTQLPDAVSAVIAGAIREHPTSSPEQQAHAAVRALRDQGWHIAAPEVIAAALRAA
ncbi:hypothetical protein [Streptomyces microflavus]|uniref:hypothetical protein n=1 Tax=Streptomyces microflavus TaxID=1919 RepID=UPI0013E0728D|nr:hypothetical protein [Streptomyces microflavus]